MIALLMAADLYAEAFKLTLSVEKCTLDYSLQMSELEQKARPSTLDFDRWDKVRLDLADAYLAKGCASEAEGSYSYVIKSTRRASTRSIAKAGLDRALAKQQPAKPN